MCSLNNKDLSTIVRKNIRKYRLEKHYTMQTLADLVELSHGYVRELECLSFKKSPSLDAISRFADALDIDVGMLFEDN